MSTNPVAADTSFMVRAAGVHDHLAVLALLEASKLPVADVPATLDHFLVAERGGAIIGAIGLEVYGESALLRSAVVGAGEQGKGIGIALVDALLDDARTRGLTTLILLTTTAERWFPRFGFELITRKEVPQAVQASAEFRGACPASAAVMRLTLR